jgi:hypothetical protein
MGVRVVRTPGAEAHLNAARDRMLAHLGREIAADAQRYAPSDSGALRASIHADPPAGGHVRVWVGTDHWQFTEFGTRPHTITPKRKKALSWPGGAHPVHQVRHPGQPALAYMRRATYQTRSVRGL